jgi:amino acid adenylation domain-containing protein/non-ribosomal peptide synthase protein (TIGR01720 family)
MSSSAAVREAADNVRAVLLADSPAPGPVRHPLDPAAAARLDAVTGGDATLRWTAVAAAAAVVLRRFGCGDLCLIGTGELLPRVVPVSIETDPGLTFRELLGQVRATVVTAGVAGTRDDYSLAAGPGTVTVGAGDPAGGVLLAVRDGVVVGESSQLDAKLLTALVTGTAEVLRTGLTEPGTTIAELPVLAGPALDAVVNGFNRTREVRGGTAYRQLLLEQARERPQAPAIHDGRDEIDYARLCQAATLIGARLRAAGVGPDDVVALIAPRDTWFVVAAVGILFSGAAYLPIEPSIPAGRRRQMLTGVRAAISTEDLAADETGTVLDLVELRATATTADVALDDDTVTGLLGPVPDPHDLAYVIYTSGSTGVPKGASLEHHSFLNFMQLRALDCEMRPGAELPQTAPVSFDISVWQMFAPLTAGATVCVLPDEVTQDPAAMTGLIAQHGYEYVELVPTFIAVLLDQFQADPELAGTVRSRLRGLISTGEVLGVDLARRWNAEVPGVPLDNAYGPAECTDDVTQGPVAPGPDDMYTPIGKPLPNTRLYVLDGDFQPLPPGVVGEIFVGGSNVGRGYHRQPRLTAAAFLPDPYGAPGTRMYRTGDRGRWRADGVLECLGRADTQVKFRGRRIELGEISHLLEAHPDVVLAAVELVKDGTVERLVGFAACRPGSSVRPADLITHLAGQLPAFMVPHLVLVRDELPRNQNGKVDHLALRRLAAEHPVAADTYEPPGDELERTLCSVLAEQLTTGRIGIRDDFHDLGGDSIVSIRFTQALRRHGIALRPRVVLQAGTVEAMAKAIRGAGDPQGRAHTVDLTGPQQWFFADPQDRPEPGAVARLLRSARPLDPTRLEAAVRRLVERHEQLRTAFVDDDATTRQQVRPGPAGSLWRAAPHAAGFRLVTDDREVATGSLHDVATAVHRSLSPDDGGVLRVVLVGEDRVLLSAHRLVADETAMSILVADLADLYAGADPATPAVAVADWAPLNQTLCAALPPTPEELPWRPVAADAAVDNIDAGSARATLRLTAAQLTALESDALRHHDDLTPALLAGVARALAGELGEGWVHLRLTVDRRAAITRHGRTVGRFTEPQLMTLVLDEKATPQPVADATPLTPSGPQPDRPVQIGFTVLPPESARHADFTVEESVPGLLRPGSATRDLEWDITVRRVDGELVAGIEYVAGRHDRAAVERVLGRWQDDLLEQVAAATAAGVLHEVAPLSIAQEDFFRSGAPEPHHWNSSVLLTLPRSFTVAEIEKAVRLLAGRHPALRTRFAHTGSGIRQGWTEVTPPVTVFALPPGDETELGRRTQDHATELHRSLDLYDGPVCRVGVIRRPDQDRLLLIAHHAVLDMFSWDILIAELSVLLRDGSAAALPATGTSFFAWTRRLAEDVRREPDRWSPGYWLGDWSALEIAADGWGVQRDQAEIITVLDAERSAQFLDPRRHRGTVNERLTAALGRALQEWLGCPDGDVLVQLGGHGRDDLFDDLDVTATVGYFSTAYPFRLPLPGGQDDPAHLRAVVDRLRAVPDNGRGFGLLRYRHPDASVRTTLDAVPAPSIIFDFLGETRYVDVPTSDPDLDFLGDATTEHAGEARSPSMPRPALIEVRASVVEGRVSVEWLFSAEKMPHRRARDLADAYLAALCRRAEGEPRP